MFVSFFLHFPGNSRRASSVAGGPVSTLEVVAPVTSDVEFKFTWPIEGFLKHVKGSKSSLASGDGGDSDSKAGANGLDSKPFEININGVQSTWNLSIRFWKGEDGERLANPFVLCLNMVSCSINKPTEVGIKFKFGVLNQVNGEFEFGSSETKPRLRLETNNELKSVGYKNIAIGDKHIDQPGGDINLVCKMKLLKDDSSNHSLSSDLRSLINDDKTADLILEAENKTFKVHRNILAARSPVFASLLNQSKPDRTEPTPKTEVPAGTDDKTQKKAKEETTEVKPEPQQQHKPLKQQSSVQGEEQFEKITIKDLRSDTLEELLTYIYTDCSVNVDLMANSLLAAADQYQLPGLKTNCEKHFGEIISPNNVASVLMMADSYKCQNLKKSALSYCKVCSIIGNDNNVITYFLLYFRKLRNIPIPFLLASVEFVSFNLKMISGGKL